MPLWTRLVAAASLLAVLAPAAGFAQASMPKTDWPSYGKYPGRMAVNVGERTLNTATVGKLQQHWATTIDGGAILTQPIVAANISTATGLRDFVVVGTETGRIAALDAATGAVLWSHDTGFQTVACRDVPGGRYGITAAAAFTRSDGRVYVMGGDGKLYAYVLATGALVPGWPVTITDKPAVEHVYGGLLVANGGVYVTTASMCDVGPYHGRVVRVQIRPPTHITNAFYPDGTTTVGGRVVTYGPGGGGIWAPGGLSLDPTANPASIYVATGNLENATNEFDVYGDHVVRLGLDLSVIDSQYPTFSHPNTDIDFGSTPVFYQFSSACPPALAVISKGSLFFTYDRTDLSKGYLQRLPSKAFAGDVAVDPVRKLMVITAPPRVEGWVPEPQGCGVTRAWSTSETAGKFDEAVSPPTLAAGVAYYGNGGGSTLIALDATTGASLNRVPLGGPVYAAPTVVNGQVLVSSWDGKVYAFGL